MAIAAIALIFFVVLGVSLLVMGIGIYNALIALRNQVDRAWANIDVILKQRFDEIPQLVQVVEQYAQFEKAQIAAVTTARTRYGSAQSMDQKVVAAQEMTLALRGVMAIGEAYPELKANQNFIQLQGRVSQLENDISDRREVFNEAVTNLNTRIQQFPDVIFAGMLGYKSLRLFEVAASDKLVPSLKMNLG